MKLHFEPYKIFSVFSLCLISVLFAVLSFAQGSNDVTFTLEADKTAVSPGDMLHVTLTMDNPSKKEVSSLIALLSYDSTILEGKNITYGENPIYEVNLYTEADEQFIPGENLVKIGRVTTGDVTTLEETSYEIATIEFEVRAGGANTSEVVIDFVPGEPGDVEETSANILENFEAVNVLNVAALQPLKVALQAGTAPVVTETTPTPVVTDPGAMVDPGAITDPGATVTTPTPTTVADPVVVQPTTTTTTPAVVLDSVDTTTTPTTTNISGNNNPYSDLSNRGESDFGRYELTGESDYLYRDELSAETIADIVKTTDATVATQEPPSITSVTTTATSVNFRWKNTMSGAAGAYIYYSTEKDAYTKRKQVKMSSMEGSYTFSNLNPGSTMYFVFSSYDQDGKESSYSMQLAVPIGKDATFASADGKLLEYVGTTTSGGLELTVNGLSDPAKESLMKLSRLANSGPEHVFVFLLLLSIALSTLYYLRKQTTL